MPKITDLRRKLEEEISERNRAAEEAYNTLVDTPSTSQESTSNKEESTVFAKVSQKYLFAANKLHQDLQSTYVKIEELEKEIQPYFKAGSDLSALGKAKEALKITNQKKHTLKSELEVILPEVRRELNENLIITRNIERDLEGNIKSSHGEEHIQLKSELHQFRNKYLDYFKQSIEFEEEIAKNRPEMSGQTLKICNEELSTLGKIKTELEEKKKILLKNLHLHSKNSSEFDKYGHEMYENTVDLDKCNVRILTLNNKIKELNVSVNDEVEWITIPADPHEARQIALKSPFGQKDEKTVPKRESSVTEENPLYEMEIPQIQKVSMQPVQGAVGKVISQESAKQTFSGKKFDFKTLIETKEKTVLKEWAESSSEEKQIKQGAVPKKKLEQSSVTNHPTPPSPPPVDRRLKPTRLAASTLFLSKDNRTQDEEKSKEKEKARAKGPMPMRQ